MTKGRKRFDFRARAMRTMTVEQAVQAAPIKCDGDEWLLISNELPIAESVGDDEDGNPIFIPTDENGNLT